MNQVLTCPKCRGTMRTHNRHGVQIEQCDSCLGIFLDYGELEAVSRMTGVGAPPPAPPMQPPPPAGHWGRAPQHQQPAWGQPHPGWGHQPQHHHSFGRMLFFSS